MAVLSRNRTLWDSGRCPLLQCPLQPSTPRKLPLRRPHDFQTNRPPDSAALPRLNHHTGDARGREKDALRRGREVRSHQRTYRCASLLPRDHGAHTKRQQRTMAMQRLRCVHPLRTSVRPRRAHVRQQPKTPLLPLATGSSCALHSANLWCSLRTSSTR